MNHFMQLEKEYSKVYEKLQQSSHLDISQLNESMEVNDIVEDEITGCKKEVQDRLRHEFFYSGPLDPLIKDHEVTEILLNGPKNIWFEKQGQLIELRDSFLSSLTYRNFILRVCQESQIQVHLNQPFANGHWRGFRVHLIQPPLVKKDYHLSLRRHPHSPWTLHKLLQQDWCSEKDLETLKSIIRSNENTLVIGPTGTGKTSVINALLQDLPAHERVVIIEDTDELSPPSPLSVKLLTRQDNTQQMNDYDQTELLKQALRMRPQRLVLGEVRGAEAKDLLMAFATGHNGGLCSLHAYSAKQALLRLEMLIQMGAPQWNATAIRHLIFLSLKYIIELEQVGKTRKLKAIQRIASLEKSGFCLEELNSSNPYIQIGPG